MGHGLKIEFLKIEFKCWKIKCVEFHGGYESLVRNMPTLKYDSDQWERNELKRRQFEQDEDKIVVNTGWTLDEDGNQQWLSTVYPYEFFWYSDGLDEGYKSRKLEF